MGGLSFDELFGGGSGHGGVSFDDLFREPTLPAGRWDEHGRYILDRRSPAERLREEIEAENPLYYTGTHGRTAGRRLSIAEKPIEYLSEYRIKPLERLGEAVGSVTGAGAHAFTRAENVAKRAFGVPERDPEEAAQPVQALTSALVPQTPLDVGLTASPFVAGRLLKSADKAQRVADATIRAARAAESPAALEAGIRAAERAERLAQTGRTAAQVAEAGNVGIAAPAALEGGATLVEGVAEGDPRTIGRGAFQTALGTLGTVAGSRGLRQLEAPRVPRFDPDQIRADVEAAASGPQITEGNLPGGMFSPEAQAIREGRVPKPARQASIFGDETGAVRIRGRERVEIKATGEVGEVAKFNPDGSLTIETPKGKKTVQPEEVSFLEPEPLRREAPSTEPARPRSVDTGEVRPPADPAEKLMDLVEQGKVAITKTKRARTVEARRRSAEFQGRLEAGTGEAGAKAARGALAGEMPQAREALAKADFTQNDIDGLFDAVRDSHLMGYDKATAQDGLFKLLNGDVPQRSELYQLQNVFGRKFVDTVAKNPAWRRQIADALNLPRALAASFDMSAPLRQGLILSVSHPVRAAKAFTEMHRYFFSSKHFEQFQDALRLHHELPLAREAGLHLASVSPGAKRSLAHGEEIFRSNLAERLPLIGRGVKASERAYMGYLDKLRMDVFADSAKRLRKLGLDDVKNIDAFQDLAQWINIASGRGSFGRLDRAMDVAGQVFFSPRFIASRVQALNPVTYMKLSPAVRRQAAREMVTLAGVGMGVTGLAYAAGAEIERDPRATDFGKLRVGHTRVDISGGFQPYVRLVAQLAGGLEHIYQRKKGEVYDIGPAWKSGARKTLSGEIKPLTGTGPFPESRLTLINRFLGAKLSPQARLLVDLLQGHDMIGDPLQWGGNVAKAAKRGASAEDIVREITKTKQWEMFVPMFLQDVVEAIEAEGLVGGVAALPAGYGVSVGSYATPEEAWARTKRKARLSATDPLELLSYTSERRVGR